MTQRSLAAPFLRGLGTAIALPWLEAMLPAAELTGAAAPAPRRNGMAFLYVPNGVHMPAWTPEDEGAGFTLPPILEPWQPFRDDCCVLTGLAQHNARRSATAPATTPGARLLPHGRPSAQDRRRRTSTPASRSTRSPRSSIGGQTRLPSLELGCERGGQSGNCDSGYSCAYSSNISWRIAHHADGQGGQSAARSSSACSPADGQTGDRRGRRKRKLLQARASSTSSPRTPSSFASASA